MNVKLSDRLLYQAGQARVPISGVFELTPVCNFSCKMCYIRKTPEEVGQVGGLHTVDEWIDWAEQAKKLGMLYLLITGGEPFTYPGFWQLYEKLCGMGFIITINTNGSMITEQVAEKLRGLPPKRLNITLYGGSNETYENLCGIKGSFDRVIKATELLKERGIRYKFNCSLTPQNAHELERMYQIAKEQNVPIEIAPYMFPPVRRTAEEEDTRIRLTAEEAGRCAVESVYLRLDEERFRVYAQEKMAFKQPPALSDALMDSEGREMGCRAGRCSFWLDWQGNLSACGMINTPAYSLLENSFKSAWEAVVEETNKVRCLSGCSGCPNRKICHVCISTAYCETGDINGRPTYACKMLEAEARACQEKLKKMN